MSDNQFFAKPYDSVADTSQDPVRLEKLQFHIESGDLFPLLSTIVCFLEEGMRACEAGESLTIAPVETEVLKNVREDLLYLHKHYSLSPKA
jgi:hypothetical protein